MTSRFEKVLDSTVWISKSVSDAIHKRDPYIRVGVVLKSDTDKKAKDTRYLVETQDKNDKITVWCKLMTRMGGIYNYEDYTVGGYIPSPLSNISGTFANKAGDLVLVALLNGEGREGVILGGLNHPGRSRKLKTEDGPTYGSEFNGVETAINKDGEYTLTYKGVPVNQSLLKAPSALPILAPTYNPLITGSYFKIDKTGSLELNDKAVTLPQSIKIDKSSGKIEIKSGAVSISMAKLTQAIEIKSSTFLLDSKLKIDQKTSQFSVDAKVSIKLKALKIAIGSDGIELFDQLIQMIDALGKVQVISPVGPCTPFMATPGWTAVELIKAKLTVIKGSL